MTVGLFGDQPFKVLTSFPDLRWVVIRNAAGTSEQPDVIASKLDQLVTEIQKVLNVNELEIYDYEPRQRADAYDLLVLTAPLSQRTPNE